MTCTHTIERSVWVEDPYPGDDYYGEPSHWEYRTEWTTRDISTGAYQCTQCGEVMFYTGSWKKFYEQGVQCSSSEMVDDATYLRVRKEMKK